MKLLAEKIIQSGESMGPEIYTPKSKYTGKRRKIRFLTHSTK